MVEYKTVVILLMEILGSGFDSRWLPFLLKKIVQNPFSLSTRR